jgi:Calcineurin-like phosphoesterase
MDAVRKLKPDYVVHLGDVYYCGTEDRHPVHEEQDNFLAQWRTGTGAQTCFTLNSNHEMYGATQGLIDVALNDGTPFAHQKRTTYFGLSYADWVILGLDSAYFDPSQLYMKGALGNAGNTQQRDFISATFGDLGRKKVFVMTHHNPMSFDGKSLTPMWASMLETLGGKKPYAWYWGHLHLGVVYKEGKTALGSRTLGRCVGHSAIPFGDASGLNSTVADYYAHTPLGIGTMQVRNGFATVTLHAEGTLAETFYEIDANGQCIQAWPNP